MNHSNPVIAVRNNVSPRIITRSRSSNMPIDQSPEKLTSPRNYPSVETHSISSTMEETQPSSLTTASITNIEAMLANFAPTLSDIKREISEIKESQTSIKQSLDNKVETLQNDLDTVKFTNKALVEQNTALQHKVTQLEAYSRKDNLLLHNVT